MTLHRVMVVVPADNNVGEDVVVNTFGIDIVGTLGVTVPKLQAAFKALYDTWGVYRGALQDWPKMTIKGYDMTAPKPRVPVFDVPVTLSGLQATNTLPREVALCLSFQASRVSGVAQARRRGRVYFGPFAVASNNGTTSRPDNALITAVRDGAQAFVNLSSTDPDWEWFVISEATGTPIGNSVHDGWVDDAWDTQRRRGQDPSTRTAFSLTP